MWGSDSEIKAGDHCHLSQSPEIATQTLNIQKGIFEDEYILAEINWACIKIHVIKHIRAADILQGTNKWALFQKEKVLPQFE